MDITYISHFSMQHIHFLVMRLNQKNIQEQFKMLLVQHNLYIKTSADICVCLWLRARLIPKASLTLGKLNYMKLCIN